jgi:hypothetical protein
MSSLNGPSNPQKPYDTLGLVSNTLGGATAGKSGLGSSQSGFSRSSPPSDRAGRTIYISNVSVPCNFLSFQIDLLTCNRCHFDLVGLTVALAIWTCGV